MKKINPWEANDLAGYYEERGFHPTKWEEVTEFDEEGYGWVCTDNGRGFVNQEGYLVIPDEVADSEDLLSAANVATRILGFVNAPTLQQKVVEKCLDAKTDLSFYNRNREDLYNGLKECGFEYYTVFKDRKPNFVKL